MILSCQSVRIGCELCVCSKRYLFRLYSVDKNVGSVNTLFVIFGAASISAVHGGSTCSSERHRVVLIGIRHGYCIKRQNLGAVRNDSVIPCRTERFKNNFTKTQIMIVLRSLGYKLVNPTTHQLIAGGISVPWLQKVKYLELIIDNKLLYHHSTK